MKLLSAIDSLFWMYQIPGLSGERPHKFRREINKHLVITKYIILVPYIINLEIFVKECGFKRHSKKHKDILNSKTNYTHTLFF